MIAFWKEKVLEFYSLSENLFNWELNVNPPILLTFRSFIGSFQDGVRWFRTGDLATKAAGDPYGNVSITGRHKEQVRSASLAVQARERQVRRPRAPRGDALPEPFRYAGYPPRRQRGLQRRAHRPRRRAGQKVGRRRQDPRGRGRQERRRRSRHRGRDLRAPRRQGPAPH